MIHNDISQGTNADATDIDTCRPVWSCDINRNAVCTREKNAKNHKKQRRTSV